MLQRSGLLFERKVLQTDIAPVRFQVMCAALTSGPALHAQRHRGRMGTAGVHSGTIDSRLAALHQRMYARFMKTCITPSECRACTVSRSIFLTQRSVVLAGDRPSASTAPTSTSRFAVSALRSSKIHVLHSVLVCSSFLKDHAHLLAVVLALQFFSIFSFHVCSSICVFPSLRLFFSNTHAHIHGSLPCCNFSLILPFLSRFLFIDRFSLALRSPSFALCC